MYGLFAVLQTSSDYMTAAGRRSYFDVKLYNSTELRSALMGQDRAMRFAAPGS